MRALALMIAALGLVITVHAAFIPAKAWLGQRMLAAAWKDAMVTGAAQPPWGWADFAPAARITAPRLGVSAIALDGATGAAMAWGPGAVPGLATPGRGLAAYAGHRDTHLAFLADLKPGDEVQVETVDGQQHMYAVTSAIVVDSRQWRFPADGTPGLALATCWPLNAATPGPLRLVVFADPA